MNDQNRVLVRKGARDLNEHEVVQVSGGLRTLTAMHPGCSRHSRRRYLPQRVRQPRSIAIPAGKTSSDELWGRSTAPMPKEKNMNNQNRVLIRQGARETE